jgi:DNA polymerase-3 subunit epsilon
MARMLDLASSISYIECSTELEASVRELRIIQTQKPTFNRSGTRTESPLWLRLTKEPYPRLSVVRAVRPDLGYLHLGPIRNREQATLVVDAITSVIQLRTCTTRLSTTKATPSCALAEIGRCSAPCELAISPSDYQQLVDRLFAALNGFDEIEDWIRNRIATLATAEKFEEAALWRDRLAAWLSTSSRTARMHTLSKIPEVVLAAPADSGWDIHVIRHGALAAAARVDSVNDIQLASDSLRLSAQVFEEPALPAPTNTVAEANLILSWIFRNDIRLVNSVESLSSSWPTAQSKTDLLDELISGRQSAYEVAKTRSAPQYSPPR